MRKFELPAPERPGKRLFPPGISLAEELAIRDRCIREHSRERSALLSLPPTPAKRGRKRTILGEGMLTPIRRFIFEGEEYIPGVVRVAPEHRSVKEMGGEAFRAAMPGDRDPAVIRALRSSGRSNHRSAPSRRPCRASSRPARWRLPRSRRHRYRLP